MRFINADQCGEASLLLDEGKLRSACGRPFHTFDGFPVEPVLVNRAAMVLDGLCQAHAFADGNKRTAWLCMLALLEASGVTLRRVGTDVAEQFVIDVVTHKLDVSGQAAWISTNIAKVG